jgi:hypothetical protein
MENEMKKMALNEEREANRQGEAGAEFCREGAERAVAILQAAAIRKVHLIKTRYFTKKMHLTTTLLRRFKSGVKKSTRLSLTEQRSLALESRFCKTWTIGDSISAQEAGLDP